MGTECNILAIGGKFDILNPERLLPWLGFAKFGLTFIKLIELGVKQIYFAFVISNNYELTCTLLPINTSYLLFHLKYMGLLH